MIVTAAEPIESEYSRVVVKYSGSEYGKMFQWCFENCNGNFFNSCYTDTVYFYFESEHDAVRFSLTWY